MHYQTNNTKDMGKELPIQKVSFRGEKDVFRKEGASSDKLPKFVSDERIRNNGMAVCETLKTWEELFDENTQSAKSLPVLAVASLDSNASAKSYRKSVRSLFDVKNKRNVIGVENQGGIIVKIDNKTDYEGILRNFQSYSNENISKNTKIGLASVVAIDKFHPYIEDGLNENDTLKVKLIDYQNAQLNTMSKRILYNYCAKHDVYYKELDYSSGLRLFELKNVNDTKALASLDGIISVKRMPTIEIESAPEDEISDVEIITPVKGQDYPIVGVLDSGISRIPQLDSWIESENNIADFEDDDIDYFHGTAVAGIINYGDYLSGCEYTGCKPCRMVSCIINSPRLTVGEHELILYIRKSIEAHPEVKVWNLSQGIRSQIDDEGFPDLGIALDEIQKENNVLICKSAGNKTDDWQRINKGADSILSLVVGSVAHEKKYEEDCEVGMRSPFSLVGPGPNGLIKPDLAHYGGNTKTGVPTLSVGGMRLNVLGTSFSTPRISSLAANLANLLDDDFNPLLIKAILIHNSKYHSNVSLNNVEELLAEQGRGIPSILNDMLHNDENECTMVFAHTLDKGMDMVTLDFPYPPCLVGDDGYYYGDITVTLVTEPVLDATQGNEYCQSNVEVLLETYDNVKRVDLSNSKYYLNEYRMDSTSQNILSDTIYSKALKSPLNERALIEKGLKYQPVKKYHVNLEKVTKGKKESCLKSNRKWGLKLEGLYRDHAEVSREKDGVDISQKIILIVTIKDTKRKGLVYNECIQKLDINNYEHMNIMVEERISVE